MRKNQIKKLLTICSISLVVISLFPFAAYAANGYLQFNTTYNPTANPGSVVVNQPFMLQIVSYDDMSLPAPSVYVTIQCPGLHGTLSGTTGNFNPLYTNIFVATNCYFSTPGNYNISASAVGYDLNTPHNITVSSFGSLYTIGCASPLTSLFVGQTGTFAVHLEDEWGNTISTAGETITTSVTPTGGATIDASQFTNANGSATFNITAGATPGNITVTFASGGVTRQFTMQIRQRPPSKLPKTGDGFPMGPLLALLGVSLIGIEWMSHRKFRAKKTQA